MTTKLTLTVTLTLTSLICAPVFAVADHCGRDPASSVLSFKGRCYLLIQIQVRVTVTVRVSLV